MVKPIIMNRTPCMNGRNSPITPRTMNTHPATTASAFFTPTLMLLQHKMPKPRVKETEDYVLTVFGSRPSVLPPEKHDQGHHHDARHQIKAPHHSLQLFPLLPKEAPCTRNDRPPQHSSHEIKD